MGRDRGQRPARHAAARAGYDWRPQPSLRRPLAGAHPRAPRGVRSAARGVCRASVRATAAPQLHCTPVHAGCCSRAHRRLTLCAPHLCLPPPPAGQHSCAGAAEQPARVGGADPLPRHARAGRVRCAHPFGAAGGSGAARHRSGARRRGACMRAIDRVCSGLGARARATHRMPLLPVAKPCLLAPANLVRDCTVRSHAAASPLHARPLPPDVCAAGRERVPAQQRGAVQDQRRPLQAGAARERAGSARVAGARIARAVATHAAPARFRSTPLSLHRRLVIQTPN